MTVFLIIVGILILIGILGNQAAKKKEVQDAKKRDEFNKQ
jgi:uncharacterized BrkB/YihY/UPF0761 family membrane protein